METITNVVADHGVSVMAQLAIFPLFAFYATVIGNMKMAAIFIVLSMVRGYVLKRELESRGRKGALPR